jgi:hypothetical protein
MKNAQDVMHKISALVDNDDAIDVIASSKGTLETITRIIRADGKVYLMTIQEFVK